MVRQTGAPCLGDLCLFLPCQRFGGPPDVLSGGGCTDERVSAARDACLHAIRGYVYTYIYIKYIYVNYYIIYILYITDERVTAARDACTPFEGTSYRLHYRSLPHYEYQKYCWVPHSISSFEWEKLHPYHWSWLWGVCRCFQPDGGPRAAATHDYLRHQVRGHMSTAV
jgi:hypothetical protein